MSQLLYQRYIGSVQRVFSVENGGSVGGYIRITGVSDATETGGIVLTGNRVHDGMQHAVSCCQGGSKEALVETVFKEYSEELMRALTDTATLTDVNSPLLAVPLSELKRSLLLQAQLGLDGMQMHSGTRPGTLAAKAEAAASRHVSQEVIGPIEPDLVEPDPALQIESDPAPPQVLKLLREELRPALRKCWSAEAARVASAVAASEDDRASTATNSIDFIKRQLVQNGTEAAEKLRGRLAGAWHSKEPGADTQQRLKQLQAPEIFGDGERWQGACESRLEEVRILVSAFFAEGEQLGSDPGGSTSIDLIEERIGTLELELGDILCSAVAGAALLPLRDLTCKVNENPPTPQQQAKALVLQRAYRLGAPSRSPQRAAFVRAGLLAALSDTKLEAQRSGASHATLLRVNEALSRWASAARAFAWIDTTAVKAARDVLENKAEAARKKEQSVGMAAQRLLKKHKEVKDRLQEAEDRLKQAKAEAAVASKEAAINPERNVAATQAVNRVPDLQAKLEKAKEALKMSQEKTALKMSQEKMSEEKLARQDTVVQQAVATALGSGAAKVSRTATGPDGEQSSRVHSRDAYALSCALADSMRSLLGRLREGLVDTLAGPDRAVEKACVVVQKTVDRVMGSAVLAHDKALEPIATASFKLKDELQQLQQKRKKADSKREWDEENSNKLQALEKEAKRASASVMNGEKLGKTLRDSMVTLNADVAAAVSLNLEAWRRDLSAELVTLRGGTLEAVLCVMHQLPGTAEGELLKVLTQNVTATELVQIRATLRRATALLYTRCVHALASGRAYFCALCEDAQRPAEDSGGMQCLCQWSSRVCSAWPRECWMDDRAEETFAVAQLILQPLPAFRWLRLEEDATPDDVSRAFRSCSRQHHPDKGGSAELLELTQTCAKLLRDTCGLSHANISTTVQELRSEMLKTYLTGRNHEEFIASMEEDLSAHERLRRMQQVTERAAKGATKPSRGLIEDLSMFPAQMPRISARASSPTNVQLRWAAKLSGYWLSLGATFEVGHARSCGRAAPVWSIVYRGPATQAEVGDLRDDDPEYISTQVRIRTHLEPTCAPFEPQLTCTPFKTHILSRTCHAALPRARRAREPLLQVLGRD